MANIDNIKYNATKEEKIIGMMNSVIDTLTKIANFFDTLNLSEPVQEPPFTLSTLSEIEKQLGNIKYAINDMYKSKERKLLMDEYEKIYREYNALTIKTKDLLHLATISKLHNKNELLLKGTQGLNNRRFVAKQMAETAKQKAKEAEALATAKQAEQKIAEQKAKEAEALATAKQLEEKIAIEKNQKENLILLNSLRDKERKMIDETRAILEQAEQKLAEAIKAENIIKAKEISEQINKETNKIANLTQISNPCKTQHTHAIFDSVLKDIQQNISPMLVGPAGSGKSTILQNVADTLNLNYYPLSVNGQTSEYQIIGYKNANGDYIRSAFRDAFENGGLFSFEEIDAGNPNVLTVMNNALSQDFYMFPDACVKKHRDFRLAASANTYGRGANLQYIGRNPLDAATLDRFAMSYVDYDEDLERQIGPDIKWTQYVQTIRHVIEHFNMPIIVSTRAIIFGGRDVKSGTKWDDALQKFVWRGHKAEEIKKVLAKVDEITKPQYNHHQR